MLCFRELEKKASWTTFVPFLFKLSYKQKAKLCTKMKTIEIKNLVPPVFMLNYQKVVIVP